MIASGSSPAVVGASVSVLLHVSDLHFGTEDPVAVEALAALARQEQPDAVIASGDITQRARMHEFEAARRFLGRLGARHVLVVPGNHDIPRWDLPQRLLAPFAAFRSAFGDELEPRLVSPFVWIAGLVSARRWRHASGAVSRDQVERTARWLESAPPGVLKVVTMHHPLELSQPMDRERDATRRAKRAVLAGAGEACARWLRAGVHVVLGGHSHAPLSTRFGGQADPDRGAGGSLWLAQAGTAVSTRVQPPGVQSVNLLRRADPGRWRLEQWDLLRERAAFSCRHWREVAAGAT